MASQGLYSSCYADRLWRLSPVAETCVGPAGLWNGVPVAIKIVPSFKIARSELALQEAVLGSSIQHPNVVRYP